MGSKYNSNNCYTFHIPRNIYDALLGLSEKESVSRSHVIVCALKAYFSGLKITIKKSEPIVRTKAKKVLPVPEKHIELLKELPTSKPHEPQKVDYHAVLVSLGLTPKMAYECLNQYGEKAIKLATVKVQNAISDGEVAEPAVMLVAALSAIKTPAAERLDSIRTRLVDGGHINTEEFELLPLAEKATLEYSQDYLEKTNELIYFNPETWKGVAHE